MSRGRKKGSDWNRKNVRRRWKRVDVWCRVCFCLCERFLKFHDWLVCSDEESQFDFWWFFFLWVRSRWKSENSCKVSSCCWRGSDLFLMTSRHKGDETFRIQDNNNKVKLFTQIQMDGSPEKGKNRVCFTVSPTLTFTQCFFLLLKHLWFLY